MSTGVALFGYGHWGRNLARNFAELGVLRAIADPDPAALEQAQRGFPDTRVSREWNEFIDNPAIDACVIATPAALHFDVARRALEAGKDVFIEKPLALTVKEGEALVELAAEQRRVLMVGHVLEYHPAIERLRALVSDGELGKIQYVYSTRLNLGRIRTEENALWSFAPHDIHVMLRLLREEPVDVACQGGSYLSHEVADVTMSLLRFASGVRGHIFVSWLHPFKEQKLVVVGDRKMAVFDDTLASGKLQLFPHRVDWIERLPVAVKAEAEVVPLAEAEPLALECRHFLECVETRATPRTDGANGVAVLRVLEACQQSLDRGGAPMAMTRPVLPSPPPATRYFAHPTATIDAGCDIGEGTKIWHYSHVMPGARIGRGCSLGQNVFVARDVSIGDNVKIQNNVSLYEGVVLEDDVFCGPSMVFTNVLNPRSHVSRKNEYRATLVQRGATIGANATVVCGHIIGRYAFVAAGAVVTHDVPAYALVLGSPARVAGWMCACGVRLVKTGGELNCPACERRYRSQGETIEPVRGEGPGR